MQLQNDIDLLDAWRRRRDREAMDRLIRRHINVVYATARRQMGNADLAQDVTQAVFMLLIQKSPRIRDEAALAVWLHRTTGFTSANARRMEFRRARRERMAESEAVPVDNDDRLDLAAELDEAMKVLSPGERAGVILCYLQRCTYGQIGAMLGITEEAARKRVSRSLERLRSHFRSRGVVTSAAALAACFEAESAIAAPAPLLAATTNIATLSQLTAAATTPSLIMKTVAHAMLVTKLKFAAAACAAIMIGGAATGAAIYEITVTPAILTSTTLLMQPYEARSDNIEVKFLGVAKWGAEENGWFAIDGTKIDDPRGPFANERHRAPQGITHQAVIHVSGHDLSGGYSVKIPQASAAHLWDLTPSADEAYLLVPFSVPANQKTVDLELSMASGEWRSIVTAEHRVGDGLGSHETELGGVVFTHIMEGEGGEGSMVYVAHEFKGPQFEVFAIDDQGKEERARNISGGPVGKFNALRYDFTQTPEQITALVVKVRPFDIRITAKNVTLDPAHPTKPQVDVTQKKN